MGGPFASDPPIVTLPSRNQTMTVWNAGLAVAAIGLSAVAAGGEDVTLRWKFAKNKVYRYVIAQEVESCVNLANGNISTEKYQRSETTWTVKSVRPDGSAEVSQVYDRIQVGFGSHTGEVVDVDSRRKADAGGHDLQDVIRRLIDEIVGTPIDVVISARGEVISVKVPVKIVNAIDTAGVRGQLLANIFTDAGTKQMAVHPPLLLPEKAVSAGSTWAHKRSVATAMFGETEIAATYTERGHSPGTPRLRQIDGNFSMQFRHQENAQPSYRIISQAHRANFLFDARAGHLNRSEMKESMRVEITAGPPFTQDLSQAFSMTLVGEPAAKWPPMARLLAIPTFPLLSCLCTRSFRTLS